VSAEVKGSQEARSEAPWRAGLRAARANVLPGLVVQGVMLALLLGYYILPAAREALGHLADLKARWGYCYSGIASVLAGAILPELLRIGVFQKWRAGRENVRNLLFTIPFWCVMGIMVDILYRKQAMWFSPAINFPVVATKVAVDQFLYSPFVSAPLTVWFYEWKNRGRPPGLGRFFSLRYYREEILPVVMAIWGVWLPIVTILYCLPEALQIPLFALALTLWVMLYTWMSEERIDRGAGRRAG
jgi:hypothetical protein